jgi:hypothetical protein
MSFHYGDKVKVSGVRGNLNGNQVVVARTLEKDGQTIQLRDEQGRAQWNRPQDAQSSQEQQRTPQQKEAR